MPLELRDWITKDMVRAEPDTLFVFGDNLGRWGRAGQAAEMRGEPNAIGMPTKATPYIFLKDGDLDRVKRASERDYLRLVQHLLAGKVVVWPAAGIGTGLADLEARAPRVAAYYGKMLERLREVRSNPGIWP